MKIVLKNSKEKDKDLKKPIENKQKPKDNTTKKKNNALKLVFGDNNDTSSDTNFELDGKHILSRNKSKFSKHTSELFKTKDLPTIEFDSLNDSVPDPELDPQLYLYDEFVSDKDENESKKLKYLGYVEKSKSDDEKDQDKEEETKEEKESRYMSKMVNVASKRQMERDIAFEKQLLKEELKSDSNVGEVFVTGAYKKKLEERKKFEEEQRKQDEYDALHSKNSLTKLHTYLLNTGLAKRTTNTSK